MMPPNQGVQQALLMRRMMGQQSDPLAQIMQSLGQQAMAGEMLKETANHKMKMLKLRQKYQSQQQGPMGQPGGYQ